MATKKPIAKTKSNKGLISLLKKNITFWNKELKKPNVSVENKKFFRNEINENKKVISNLEKQEKGLKGLPSGMTKSIAKTIKVTGLRKEDGTLQKGYKYAKGGKIVKAKTNKKVTKTAK